jgi:hypothetical protein
VVIFKASACDDHYVVFSTVPSPARFNWDTASNRVVFAFDCDKKFIYGATSVSEPCSRRGESTWTLRLTDTAAWFTDECNTIELAHSLGGGPFYLFIGADNDYGSAVFRHLSTSASPPPSPPPLPSPPPYPPGATLLLLSAVRRGRASSSDASLSTRQNPDANQKRRLANVSKRGVVWP